MYKHATCLTLALITLLHLSTTAATRHPRSIWPWSASETQEEPLISEKHAEILRQAGYGHFLDLSSHPLWKVHKYEGIDLKPVQVETEVIKSSAAGETGGGERSPPQLPQLDERNPVSSVAPLTESQQTESDAESASPSDESDSGLFGNFSLLSYLLPNFSSDSGNEDEEETEKASALADAIRNEEQSHPGFFAKLWSKIWRSDKSQSQAVELTESDYGEYAQLPETIALPPTRQRYAEISLVQPTARQTHYVIREQPANQANHYVYNAGAVGQQQQQQQQQQTAAVVQPIGKWYPNQQLHHSQAYIQSWNPNAAYNVHVAGPSEYPSEHVATVQAYTANHFQRKVSDSQIETQEEVARVNNHSRQDVMMSEQAIPTTTTENSVRVPKSQRNESEKEKRMAQEEVVAASNESQVQEVDLESQAKNKSEWETVRESIVQALGSRFIPKKIANKLKNIERLINDKKAGQESINELKKLQDEFEAKKKHLGPFYPEVRRAFPPIPTAPMSQ